MMETKVRIRTGVNGVEITSMVEVTDELAAVIKGFTKVILAEIQTSLPECIQFGLHPTNEQNSMCVSSMTILISHACNDVKSISEAAALLQIAHRQVLEKLQTELVLREIHKNLAEYAD